jgi:hypothetical protein
MVRPSLSHLWEAWFSEDSGNKYNAEAEKTVRDLLPIYSEVEAERVTLQTLEAGRYDALTSDVCSEYDACVLCTPVYWMPDRTPTTQPSALRMLGLGVGVAIAFSALLLLGTDNYRLRQDLDHAKAAIAVLRQQAQDKAVLQDALRQDDIQLYSLQGSPAPHKPTGTLLFSPDQQTLVVVTTHLPKLTAEQAYRLWAIAPDGRSIYYGQLEAASANEDVSQVLMPISAPVDPKATSIAQFVITLEPAAEPPRLKESVVMSSKF